MRTPGPLQAGSGRVTHSLFHRRSRGRRGRPGVQSRPIGGRRACAGDSRKAMSRATQNCGSGGTRVTPVPCGVMGATIRAALRARRARVIPGGVNSPVRSWRAVGGNPALHRSAPPARTIIDADGQTLPRLRRLLGTADPRSRASRRRRGHRASRRGPGRASARRPRSRSSWRELVTEAHARRSSRCVSSAPAPRRRCARCGSPARPPAATRIVKFTGCYHGHVDALLVRAGSGALTLGVPDSPGVPAALAEPHPARRVQRRRRASGRCCASAGREIAAVIVEPVAGNMGVVPPEPGFLETLREETARAGSPADLRRGDDRLPGRLGRGAGTLRRHARPDLPREDHRRRACRSRPSAAVAT